MEGILKSHPVTNLKKEIRKTNITGYSKMKKAEIIQLMLKHQDRFKHIKMHSKKEIKPVKKTVRITKPKKEVKPEPKKEVKPEPKKEVKPKPAQAKQQTPKKGVAKKKPEKKEDFLNALLQFYNNKKITEPIPFLCSPKLNVFYYIYILKKNKNDCFIVTGKNKILAINLLLNENNTVRGLSGQYFERFKLKPLAEVVAKKYEECKKNNKILVIPLGLPGHANMAIFNTQRNEFERFEPYGGGFGVEIDKFLKDVLLKEINSNLPKEDQLKYVSPGQACGIGGGFQMEESIEMKTAKYNDIVVSRDDGYCCVYSLLWADFRMQNPKLSSKQVFDKVSKFVNFKTEKGKILFKQMVRGLTQLFFNELKKFGKQNGLTDEEFEKVAENLADGTGFGEKMEKIFNSFTGKELYNALKT